MSRGRAGHSERVGRSARSDPKSRILERSGRSVGNANHTINFAPPKLCLPTTQPAATERTEQGTNVRHGRARCDLHAERLRAHLLDYRRPLREVCARRPCTLSPWRAHVQRFAPCEQRETHGRHRMVRVGVSVRAVSVREVARCLTWVPVTSGRSAQPARRDGAAQYFLVLKPWDTSRSACSRLHGASVSRGSLVY